MLLQVGGFYVKAKAEEREEARRVDFVQEDMAGAQWQIFAWIGQVDMECHGLVAVQYGHKKCPQLDQQVPKMVQGKIAEVAYASSSLCQEVHGVLFQ